MTAIDLTTLNRVLIIKLRHHGDVLLTSPLFTVLKNRAPHLEIDALVYEDTREMLSLHTAITHLFGLKRSNKQPHLLTQIQEEWALFKQLHSRHYDLIIHLTEHSRGMWWALALHSPHRLAYNHSQRKGRLWRYAFNHLAVLGSPRRHTVEKHLDVLRKIGISPQESEKKLVLVPGDAATQRISQLMSYHQLTPRGFIHIHPASRWLFKCWPAEKMAQLITQLQQQGETIVLTAAPDATECAMIDNITARLDHKPIDLSGQLSLKELAALTAQAKCFIGVDSAPMHIAAAMQTPVVTLFGPSGDLEWGPWRVNHRTVTLDYSCRPCGVDGCGGSKVSDCLVNIPVEKVKSAVGTLLQASAQHTKSNLPFVD